MTDAKGVFTANLANAAYLVTFSKEGFLPLVQTVKVAKKDQTISFILTSVSTPPPIDPQIAILTSQVNALKVTIAQLTIQLQGDEAALANLNMLLAVRQSSLDTATTALTAALANDSADAATIDSLRTQVHDDSVTILTLRAQIVALTPPVVPPVIVDPPPVIIPPTSVGMFDWNKTTYQGSFRLAESLGSADNNGFSFAPGPIALRPGAQSLFLGSFNSHVAEIAVPPLVKLTSPDISGLSKVPTFLQPLSDPAQGTLNTSGVGGNLPSGYGGMTVLPDGTLHLAGFLFYDANNDVRASHFRRSADLTTSSSFSGWFPVGDPTHQGFVGQALVPIPTAWQTALGGTYLATGGALSIITRTSAGPSATVFDATLGDAATPVAGKLLLGYPTGHETLGTYLSAVANPAYNQATALGGAFIIDDSLVFLGRTGLGKPGYGPGTSDPALAGTPVPGGNGEVWIYDPINSDKGGHAWPYVNFAWVYRLSDLAAVKAGTKQPWEVIPAAMFPFDLPLPVGQRGLFAGYDPTTQTLVIAQPWADPGGGYFAGPVFHVFSLSAPPPPPPPPPIIFNPPSFQGKATLLPSDLVFDGLFTLPDYVGLDFSAAIFAAHRVNGELRFVMTGSEAQDAGGKLIEFTVPSSLASSTADLLNAPKAAFTRSWLNGFGARRLTAGAGVQVMGLRFKDDVLYCTYGDHYNVAGHHEPSICASRLNADGTVDTFGPWRTADISQRTRGYMVKLPEWFKPFVGDKAYGIGAPNTSGDAGSPHGTYLAVLDLPSIDTPPDVLQDALDTPHISVATRPILAHDINHKMKRDTNWRSVGWTILYDYNAPLWNAPGNDEETQVDTTHSAEWIDTPTKSGLIFLGQQAKSVPGFPYENGSTVVDVWYGINPGPYGQRSRGASISTGPASGSEAPIYWMYGPESLVNTDPYAVTPVAEGLFNLIAPSAVPQVITTYYQFGAQFWDNESQRWFVSMALADGTARYDPKPIMLQFSVKP